MADELDYDELLNQAVTGRPSAASPAYDKLLDEATGGSYPKNEAGATVIPDQPKSEYDQLLDEATGPAKKGLVETFTSGFSRGVQQMALTPSTLRYLYEDQFGDPNEAIRRATEVKTQLEQIGDGQWDLSKIHNLEDFSYWLSEKLGEQGPQIIASLATGGPAGMAASGIAKKLLLDGAIKTGTAKAIAMAGTALPTYALTTGLETAGTAQEQFDAFGQINAKTALGAGAIKGLFELYTPMRLTNALTKEGLQLGRTTIGGIAKTAVGEGLTEGIQETVDVYARMLHDPNYSFFDPGASWYLGEGARRVIEATVTGAAVGGVYGAPASILEQRAERNRGQPVGDRSDVGGQLLPLPNGAPGAPPLPGAMEYAPARDSLLGPATSPLTTRGEATPPEMRPVQGSQPDTRLDIIAPDAVNFKTEYANRNSETWKVESAFGSAWVRVNKVDGVAHISSTGLNKEADKGAGHGLAIYKAIVDKAHALGYSVRSDDSVSHEAARMYEALQRRGYQVIGPRGQADDFGLTRGFDLNALTDPGVFLVPNPNDPRWTQKPLTSAEDISKEQKPGNLRLGPGFQNPIRNAAEGATGDIVPGPFGPAPPRDLGLQPPANELARPTPGYDRSSNIPEGPHRQIFQAREALMVEQQLAEYKASQERLRREGFRVIEGGKDQASTPEVKTDQLPPGLRGPVTEMRRMILPVYHLDHTVPLDAGANSIYSDTLDINPHVKTLVDPTDVMERWKDTWDGAVKRYVEILPNGQPGSRIYTDVEIEREQALGRPASARPVFSQVRPDMFQPIGISALLEDLPEVTSERIFFAPQLKAPREYLLDEYVKMLETRDAAMYTQLLTMGLRVIPSRGFGFYYNGKMQRLGPPVDLGRIRPNRTSEVGWWDPNTGVMTPFRYQPPQDVLQSPIARGIPISLDLNKAREGVDYKIVKVTTPGLTGERQEYHLLKPLDPNKTTPGIVAFPYTVVYAETETRYGRSGTFTSRNEVQVTRTANPLPDPSWQDPLDKAIEWANELAPAVKTILESLGITEFPTIRVGVSPWVANGSMSSLGMLEVNIGAEDIWATKGKANFMETILHEVGHWATLYWYKQLPTEVRASLMYGWNKAQIAGTYGEFDKSRSLLNTGLDQSYYRYYMAFPEWLAEQFRRWVATDEHPSGVLNKSFAEGMKELKALYKKFDTEFGSRIATDLSKPDYAFSAAMEYVRDYASTVKLADQIARQQALYHLNQDVWDSPGAFKVANRVIAAIREMLPMFPKNVQVRINQILDPGILGPNGPKLPEDRITSARYVDMPTVAGIKQGLIEIAAGSIDNSQLYRQPHQTLAHELMHAYEILGLITPEEIALIEQDIDAGGRRQWIISEQAKSQYRRKVKEFGESQGWSPEKIQLEQELVLARETRAYHMQEYAKGGRNATPAVQGIYQRLLAFLEKVRNAIRGLGFQTKDDVIRSFFKGEIAQRAERDAQKKEAEARHNSLVANVIDQGYRAKEYANSTQTPFGTIKALYEGTAGKLPIDQDYVTYHLYSPEGRLTGILELENRMPRGFEIRWIESEGALIANALEQHAEKDLGIKMKLSGTLTEAGFAAASFKHRKDPKLLELYTKVTKREMGSGKRTTFYVSPHKIGEWVDFWNQVVEEKKAGLPSFYGGTIAQAKGWQEFWEKKFRALPPNVWADPNMDKLFNLKQNHALDGWQGSLITHGQDVEEGKLLQSMGFQSEAPSVDHFTEAFQQGEVLSQAKNASVTRKPFETSAADSMLTYDIRRQWEWFTNYGSTAEVRRELVNLKHEQDRIGKYTKWFWNLKQLAFRNENLKGLRDYVNFADLMRNKAEFWLQKANETARAWEKVPEGPRRQAVADSVFALTEMEYLSAAEKAAKTTRNPSGWMDFLSGLPPSGETLALFQKHNVSPQDYAMIRRISKDFWDFLEETKRVMEANLRKTFATSPAELALALTKLQADFAEMQNKPYFPMVRFGEFTITVRDEQTNKVIWSSAYGSQSERDAAVATVRSNHPMDKITVSRVDPRFHEFMGLPAPLLNALKSELPVALGLNPTERAKLNTWIEEFEMLNAPDRSFRKRWLVRAGLPGYNLDAFRAYAHYFTYGSRYLARLEFMNDMQASVAQVQRSAVDGSVGNSAKRNSIATYMANHFKYVMEGGDDAGKLRAFAAFWFLGFSPAAAITNLTQPLVTVWPALAGHFGQKAAFGAFSGVTKALKSTAGRAVGSPAFMTAKMEAIRQGVIDIGQAATLAGFADGLNLTSLLSGTRQQVIWRNLQHYAMWMFSVTEQFNRQFTFKAAWDLAIKYPDTQRLKQLDSLYDIELKELQGRTGLTRDEAVAFLFAKEMIERTQFDYGKDADAPFMRNPKAKELLIFFKYTQNMLYALRFNGAMTHMFLVMALLGGVGGLPFAEEFSEGIQAILKLANYLFGTHFDLNGSARKFVRELTRGTPFDEVGPDLFLHGVSRYGFGLGLLPESWGLPKFDASANVSMGRIIPGVSEFLHGFNTDSKFKDALAETAQKASGAAYGQMMTMMSYMMDPYSVDGHKWEQLLPRFLHGMAKSYRYGLTPGNVGSLLTGQETTPGAETTRAGARIARFDISDPGDLTTVLAQALGYTPTKIAMTWDVLREAKETIQIYNARRSAIYAQFDKALLSGNKQAIVSVERAIKDYNDQVKDVDPSMMIKASQVQTSLRERQRQRGMMEQTLAGNKRDYLVTRRVLDQYPGVRIEKVR